MHRPNSSPAFFPEAFSRIGMTTSRIVPGSMVLRMTITGAPGWVASVRPICSQTRLMYLRSMPPFGWLGVPTQTNARSVWRTASPTSVEARSRPAAACSAMISPRSFSMMGERPELIRSTLVFSGSTPRTSCPSLARHPADTAPTYPSPKTQIFIGARMREFLLRGCQERAARVVRPAAVRLVRSAAGRPAQPRTVDAAADLAADQRGRELRDVVVAVRAVPFERAVVVGEELVRRDHFDAGAREPPGERLGHRRGDVLGAGLLRDVDDDESDAALGAEALHALDQRRGEVALLRRKSGGGRHRVLGRRRVGELLLEMDPDAVEEQRVEVRVLREPAHRRDRVDRVLDAHARDVLVLQRL